MIIVSACLLGVNCRYNGGNSKSLPVIAFLHGKNYLPVCPEQAGGLTTPRAPCEIRDGRVCSKDGEDVTEKFLKGAEVILAQALDIAKAQNEEIEVAVLKAGSPSCGLGAIYDGSFTGTVVEGDGILTALLKENGINVISEEGIADGKL